MGAGGRSGAVARLPLPAPPGGRSAAFLPPTPGEERPWTRRRTIRSRARRALRPRPGRRPGRLGGALPHLLPEARPRRPAPARPADAVALRLDRLRQRRLEEPGRQVRPVRLPVDRLADGLPGAGGRAEGHRRISPPADPEARHGPRAADRRRRRRASGRGPAVGRPDPQPGRPGERGLRTAASPGSTTPSATSSS